MEISGYRGTQLKGIHPAQRIAISAIPITKKGKRAANLKQKTYEKLRTIFPDSTSMKKFFARQKLAPYSSGTLQNVTGTINVQWMVLAAAVLCLMSHSSCFRVAYAGGRSNLRYINNYGFLPFPHHPSPLSPTSLQELYLLITIETARQL